MDIFFHLLFAGNFFEKIILEKKLKAVHFSKRGGGFGKVNPQFTFYTFFLKTFPNRIININWYRVWARGSGGGVLEGGGLLEGGREELGGSGGWRTAGKTSLTSSVPGGTARGLGLGWDVSTVI